MNQRDTPIRQRAASVSYEEVVPANDDIRREDSDPKIPENVTLGTVYTQGKHNADAIHFLAQDFYRSRIDVGERFDEILLAMGARPKPRVVPAPPVHPATAAAIELPPARAKFESVSDLVEQVTYQGTRVRSGTDEQIGSVIDAKVERAMALREQARKAAIVDDVAGQTKKAFWALFGLALLSIGTAIVTRIKGLWH